MTNAQIAWKTAWIRFLRGLLAAVLVAAAQAVVAYFTTHLQDLPIPVYLTLILGPMLLALDKFLRELKRPP